MKPIFFLPAFLVAIGLAAQQQQSVDSLKTISLEEVKVDGVRVDDDLPITFSDVNKREIKSRNLGQDLPILLNYLPSVVTTSNAGAGVGYTGIRVRGSDASRVNVTINGIPYNDSESQLTFWVDLPDFASSVEQFQLQRGVGTSTNGAGAFGASLNLLTDSVADVAYAEITASAGSFNTFKNNLKFSTGLFNDRIEFSGRLSRIVSDGYVDRAFSNLKSYFFQGAYKDRNTLIKTLVFGGREITYQSWFGVDRQTLKKNRTYNPAGEIYDEDEAFEGFYDNQVDDYTQDHYQLHWSEQLNPFWNFSLGINYTYGRGFYEEYNDVWRTQNVSSSPEVDFKYLNLSPIVVGESTISETENVTRKWLDNDFYVTTLAVQYSKENTTLNFGGLYSSYIGDHFGSLVWAQHAGNVLPGHRFYENQGIKREGSFFVKATRELSKWIVYLDIQLRHLKYTVEGKIKGPEAFSVDDQFVFFNPKAGLTFRINEYQRLYFSYAKAQREPNRTDYINGNPKPEKLDDFELGWRIKTPKIQLQSNLYWMTYKNQLTLTGAIDDVGAPIRQNVGRSSRIGFEMEAKIQLAADWLWKPNFALSSNKNSDFYYQYDGTLQNFGKTNIAYSPNFIAGNALVFAPSTKFQLGLFSKYIGEQFMGNIDSEKSKLKAYFVSDVNAVFTLIPNSLFKEIQFSLLINNVFNKTYVSDGYFYTYDNVDSNTNETTTIEVDRYYPQAGINFLIGINFRI